MPVAVIQMRRMDKARLIRPGALACRRAVRILPPDDPPLGPIRRANKGTRIASSEQHPVGDQEAALRRPQAGHHGSAPFLSVMPAPSRPGPCYGPVAGDGGASGRRHGVFFTSWAGSDGSMTRDLPDHRLDPVGQCLQVRANQARHRSLGGLAPSISKARSAIFKRESDRTSPARRREGLGPGVVKEPMFLRRSNPLSMLQALRERSPEPAAASLRHGRRS